MALLMGLRANEVTNRKCRDVDDDGRVLWIDRAKTRKGARTLEIRP
jgi:integrase